MLIYKITYINIEYKNIKYTLVLNISKKRIEKLWIKHRYETLSNAWQYSNETSFNNAKGYTQVKN